MRALIAISSCERDAANGNNLAIRETWLPEVPSDIDVRFFFGRMKYTHDLLPGEVRLAVDDDYNALPYKTRDSLRWALDQGYDFVFRAFTDTCVHPARLRTSGFEQHDYLGCFPGGWSPDPNRQGHYCYASGGPGYWLSRRACQVVAESEPDHWAEDLWIGDVMGKAGFRGTHDERYWFKWSGTPQTSQDAISVHLSKETNVYHPLWMFQCFKQLKNQNGGN